LFNSYGKRKEIYYDDLICRLNIENCKRYTFRMVTDFTAQKREMHNKIMFWFRGVKLTFGEGYFIKYYYFKKSS